MLNSINKEISLVITKKYYMLPTHWFFASTWWTTVCHFCTQLNCIFACFNTQICCRTGLCYHGSFCRIVICKMKDKYTLQKCKQYFLEILCYTVCDLRSRWISDFHRRVGIPLTGISCLFMYEVIIWISSTIFRVLFLWSIFEWRGDLSVCWYL